MDFSIILILMIGVVVIGLQVFLLMRSKKPESGSLNLLLQQMNELSRVVDQKMGESAKQMNEAVRSQFGDSQKLIREITKEITEVKEVGRQTASFADQLKSLQDVLKNPKQRGVLGEYYLETLLKNVLPPGSYQMQYSFKDGKIVDAAVFVKDKIIPVDSKFSLENYNRIAEAEGGEKERLEKVFVNDLKNRIQETEQYIRPSEKTTDFAFMFIPHEAIYYDLLVNKVNEQGSGDAENLIQRAARKHKVIIVSPTSFLAYLQTVLQGLKALEIEEKAQDIIKRVEDLGRHIGAYDKHFISLGKSLSTTVNHYTKAGKELRKIDKDVLKIAGDSAGIELMEIDKPEVE